MPIHPFHKPTTRVWLRPTHGAGLTEYGLIVGLVSVVAIGAVFGVGREAREAFTLAASDLGTQNRGAVSSTPGSGSVVPPAQEPEDESCFVDEPGNGSTNSFDAAHPVVCFDLADGVDRLTTQTTRGVVVEGTDGWKVVNTGSGSDQLTFTGGALDYAARPLQKHELMFPIQTGAGNDTITMTGGVFMGVSAGAGDDTLTVRNLGAINSEEVFMGTGSNTASVGCVSIPHTAWTENLMMTVEGDDVVSVENCAVQVTMTGGAALDLDLNEARSMYVYAGTDQVRGALRVTGTALRGTQANLGLSQSSATGPTDIDVTTRGQVYQYETGNMAEAHAEFSLWGDGNPTAQPVSVRLDHTAVAGSNSPRKTTAHFSLGDPGEHWTIGVDNIPLEMMTNAMAPLATIYFNAPNASSTMGFPNLELEYAVVDVRGEAGVCWPSVLSTPETGETQDLPCDTTTSLGQMELEQGGWTRLSKFTPQPPSFREGSRCVFFGWESLGTCSLP